MVASRNIDKKLKPLVWHLAPPSADIAIMGLARVFSAILLAIGSAAASSRLDVIDLPVGFVPEGITNGDEWIAYVGSLVGERTC